MPQLDREGRFKASPKNWAIKEVNDKPLFEVEYVINAMLDGSEWMDWSEYEPHTITGEYWLFKNDGQPNKHTIDALKECFGWSGHSVEDLQTSDWSHVEVQLTVETETYKNKSKLKVKWTNPGDSTVASKVSSDKLKQLDNVWGSKLRALAGPAPKKPSPPLQSARAPTSHKAPPTEDKNGQQCSQESAWEAFATEFKEVLPNGSDEERNSTWFKALRATIPNKEPEKFDGHDWAVIRENAPKFVVPF